MNNLVIALGGRLGNMLFKLSCGYEYGLKHNMDISILSDGPLWEMYYNTYDMLHVFPMHTNPLYGYVKIEESQYTYDELPFIPNNNVYLCGCFESEYYFPENSFCKKFLQIPEAIEQEIKEKYGFIDDAVGISIRRGDYLNFRNLFLIPKIEWYSEMYHKYFEGKPAIIFSDDIEWCEANMEKNKNFTFHKPSHSNQDIYLIDNPMLNLYTMGMCHDHICSDSTWSWWGCKILEKDNAINIFQDKRYKNGIKESLYIPERWIKERAIYE